MIKYIDKCVLECEILTLKYKDNILITVLYSTVIDRRRECLRRLKVLLRR